MAKSEEEREKILSEYMKKDEKGNIKYAPKYDQELHLWIKPVSEDIYVLKDGKLQFLATRKFLV